MWTANVVLGVTHLPKPLKNEKYSSILGYLQLIYTVVESIVTFT